MSGLTVKVLRQDITKVEAEALVVGFFEDVRPLKGLAGQLDWLLCGSLSRLLIKNKLHGSLGDVALLTAKGKVSATKIFLVGLGPKAGFSLTALRTAVSTAAATVAGAGVMNAALECFQPVGAASGAGIRVWQEGLAEGAGGRALTVSLIVPDQAAFKELSPLAS